VRLEREKVKRRVKKEGCKIKKEEIYKEGRMYREGRTRKMY
jgi:hypothetical protein